MQLISTLVGKIVYAVLKANGRSGSALPGLIIEKLFPAYLNNALKSLPKGVVVISGTNGKTTTTSLLVALLEAQGLRVLTNETGSNFVRGAISATAQKANWAGKLPFDIAVFEQDEAHAVHFVQRIKPRGVLLLNITRDQMDRFGEIDTTAKLLSQVAAGATEWVVLNANDERIGAIQAGKGVRRAWFAHNEQLGKQFVSDDQFYESKNPKHVLVGSPETWLETYREGKITVRHNKEDCLYRFALPGVHNAQNFVAALAALYQIVPEADNKIIEQVAQRASPVFGRGESILLPGGGELTLQLIKNPSGFTQSLKMVNETRLKAVGIAINDDYADGRDVSWLWDVQYDALRKHVVHCGGVRATDMALRLKYDKVSVASLEDDLSSYLAGIDKSISTGERGILFCTYTAMRQIRAELVGVKSGLEDKS